MNRFHEFMRSFQKTAPAVLLLGAVYVFGGYTGGIDSERVLFCYALTVILAVVAAIIDTEISPDRYARYYTSVIGKTFRGLDRASFQFRKGVRLLCERHYAAALDTLLGVEDYQLSDREKAVLFFFTGTCYRNMGYPTNSARYFVESLASGMCHPDAELGAARGYAAAGSVNEAKEFYDKLFEKNYHKLYYPFLYTDLGMMYLKAELPDEAIGCFRQGIDENMDVHSAYGGIAAAYLVKKDVRTSLEYFRRVAVSNMADFEGFIVYYINIAKTHGCYDEVCGFVPVSRGAENAEAVGSLD